MTTSLTGALCGLTLGAGLFCLWWSMWETPAQKKSPPAFILRARAISFGPLASTG